MSGFFYNLGRQIGRKAVPAIRKSKWIYDGLAGTDEEALRAELAMGRELSTELRETLQPLHDQALSDFAAGILQCLAQRVKDQRRTFRIEMFSDPSPNAMALPGGFLFLSDSLADFCARDTDELAFVIGHEMAHVIRKHAWDRMVNDAALRFASTVSSRLGPLGAWLRHEGVSLLRSAHANKSEFEADEFGLRLSAAAGYRIAGSIAFLERVGRNQPRVQLGRYLESHPAPAERIARLRSLARTLQRES